MAGEFVLAFEAVVAAVFAPDQWTRELFRLDAMLAGVVSLKVCHTGHGNGTIFLRAFELVFAWNSEMACFLFQYFPNKACVVAENIAARNSAGKLTCGGTISRFLSNTGTKNAITDIAGNRKLVATSSWSLALH